MNRSAILVVSFGTSHMDTKVKTIDHIKQCIQENYRDIPIYEAFTSGMIIRRLKEEEGIVISSVEDAILQMGMDGITDIIVQPTHILNGIENDKMKTVVMQYKGSFASIVIGKPLLSQTEDYFFVIRNLMKQLGKQEKEEAFVLMGHGTDHYVNVSYAALNYMFRQMGFRHVYLGAVEAYPTLKDIIRELREISYKKIILIPFMIVAGEHAKNDMAGEREDSWKNQLEQAGYQVEILMRGLGEYNFIGECLIEHIKAAE